MGNITEKGLKDVGIHEDILNSFGTRERMKWLRSFFEKGMKLDVEISLGKKKREEEMIEWVMNATLLIQGDSLMFTVNRRQFVDFLMNFYSQESAKKLNPVFNQYLDMISCQWLRKGDKLFLWKWYVSDGTRKVLNLDKEGFNCFSDMERKGMKGVLVTNMPLWSEYFDLFFKHMTEFEDSGPTKLTLKKEEVKNSFGYLQDKFKIGEEKGSTPFKNICSTLKTLTDQMSDRLCISFEESGKVKLSVSESQYMFITKFHTISPGDLNSMQVPGDVESVLYPTHKTAIAIRSFRQEIEKGQNANNEILQASFLDGNMFYRLFVIDGKPKYKYHAIHLCVQYSNWEMLKWLVEKMKIDLNGMYYVRLSPKRQWKTIMNKDSESETSEKKKEIPKLFAMLCSRKYVGDGTILHLLCKKENEVEHNLLLEMVKWAKSKGAEVDIGDFEGNPAMNYSDDDEIREELWFEDSDDENENEGESEEEEEQNEDEDEEKEEDDEKEEEEEEEEDKEEENQEQEEMK